MDKLVEAIRELPIDNGKKLELLRLLHDRLLLWGSCVHEAVLDSRQALANFTAAFGDVKAAIAEMCGQKGEKEKGLLPPWE